MEKKCILILPYFGKFKNYFQLFLDSCKYNHKYNWLIITDCIEDFDFPSNIKKINMSFNEMKKIFQSKFDFKISLKEPYKLCDFKPAYGYIFEEYIEGFEYWGHCDCDMLFGDLDKFLPKLFESEYDKIFCGGHLTIYKNSQINNRKFMSKNHQNLYLYKCALANPEGFAFDEAIYANNVHRLFLELNCKCFEEDISFNTSTESYMFKRKPFDKNTKRWTEERRCSHVFWTEGKIVGYSKKKNDVIKTEYLYIHLQGRKMKVEKKLRLENIIEISPEYFKKKDALCQSKREWIKYNIKLINRNRLYWGLRRFKHNLSPIKSRAWMFNPYEKYKTNKQYY